MDGEEPRRPRRGRFSGTALVTGLGVLCVLGLVTCYIEAFAASAGVPKTVRPGRLLFLKVHPLVPALSVGTMPAKGGRTALTITLE